MDRACNTHRLDILRQVQNSASSNKQFMDAVEEFANVFLQVKRGML